MFEREVARPHKQVPWESIQGNVLVPSAPVQAQSCVYNFHVMMECLSAYSKSNFTI